MNSPTVTTMIDGRLRCRGWRQEGLLRLLENVLTVAEDPEHLVVYAALGKAARDRPAYEAIVRALKDLAEGQTLIVQSGKPIAILDTHARAPLVLMANCNIVGRWANEEVFYDLEQRGLICWGGLTAGCWQYIGSQGVLQGTYEILARAASRLGASDLRGRFFLTAGLGGMGSAQPRAAAMLGAACLVVEVDSERAAKRLESGAVDAVTASLDEALAGIERAVAERRAWSIALVANAADAFPAIAAGRLRPDIVTDQTAAHDLLYGYIPQGYSPASARRERAENPAKLSAAGLRSIASHVEAMLRFKDAGAIVFDNGNLIRSQASRAGVARAFDIPVFTEAFLRPLFCEGIGSVSLDRPVRRRCRHRHHRRSSARGIRARRIGHQLDPHRPQISTVRGIARPHRVARPRRPHAARPRRQRHGTHRCAEGTHSLHARSPRCRRDDASEDHDRKYA